DLRGNPGGLVSQAVEVADMFLNRGNIITQVGRGVSDKKSYDASKEKTLTSLPLAVLVDSNTASSAEILSGALQIHHRATLFGEKTFGKGSVESLYALNKEEALSLTVAHYFLADSSTIEGVGILPDYEVNTQIIGGRDKCLASAEEFLQNIKKFIKKNPPQISGVCTKEGK
ncbi:MAG: S41 family peptidase, partial [Sulfurimonas sp.]|nr:S41 family peptidase [Sulfurimonas sp.]